MGVGASTLGILAIIVSALHGTLFAATLPPPQASVSQLRDTPGFEVFQVTFPSPVQDAEPPNGTVYVEYYKPNRPGPLPAVVLLHHWGAIRLTIEHELAEILAGRGIATALLVMPYHLQRTPPGFKSGTAMISADIPRTVRATEQTIQEIDALVCWLRSQPEVDPGRIGITGISLGAMVSALALGEIDRLDAAVLILGGANVADILWESPIFRKIRRRLVKLGYTEERLTRELAPIEPLNRLTPSYTHNVLMINGIYDFVIPECGTLALWGGLGRPPIVWVESGHYIANPALRRRIYHLAADFFLYRFGERPSFTAPRRIRFRRIKLGFLIDHAPVIGIGGAVELLGPALRPLPAPFLLLVILIVALYVAGAEITKRIFYRRVKS